ncbi:MAG: ATP-binding protein [Deltaproteobacteria bacterium]|nr:ATP-binding protein [Deltaproteobacteria bacterium]
MKIPRLQTLKPTVEKKTTFLFGPRQTGKSTLIKNELADHFLVQLLDASMRRMLLENPSRLINLIPENEKIVVVDEIQKVPELLDVVHLLIEEKKINFLLTGSSARKLKKTGVNLLGGRARTRHLFPLVCKELDTRFDLQKALQTGTLPSVYFSDSPHEDLKNYVSEYLIQEIAGEGISRNIPAFSRFLEVAALNNGQILNYAAIGSDAGVKRGTVQNYYEILEDTLIGFRLPAWRKSKTRKAIEADKFYLFDAGVVNSVVERKSVSLKTPEAGVLFETLVLNELRAWIDYRRKDVKLSHWKSKSNFEVDFLLNDSVAIEVKCKDAINEKDLRGLRAILEEKPVKNAVCVYTGDSTLKFDRIHVYPLKTFIDMVWADLLG